MKKILCLSLFFICINFPKTFADAGSNDGLNSEYLPLSVCAHGGEYCSFRMTLLTSVSKLNLTVNKNIPYVNQMKQHLSILENLIFISNSEDKSIELASKNKDLITVKEFIAEETIVKKALIQYLVIFQIKERLVNEGYFLKDSKGNICNGSGCIQVDPIISIMMLSNNGETNKTPKKPTKAPPLDGSDTSANYTPNCSFRSNQIYIGSDITLLVNDICKTPLDDLTLRLLPTIRDTIISKDDQGEIAKLIRDPGKDFSADVDNILKSPTIARTLDDVKNEIVSQASHTGGQISEGAKQIVDGTEHAGAQVSEGAKQVVAGAEHAGAQVSEGAKQAEDKVKQYLGL